MSVKKILVALTGAGISAESGFKTFRDSGGLWEQYNVEDVASIQGWHRNPKLMTDFYNDLRAQLEHAQPNNGHKVLAELEEYFAPITILCQCGCWKFGRGSQTCAEIEHIPITTIC